MGGIKKERQAGMQAGIEGKKGESEKWKERAERSEETCFLSTDPTLQDLGLRRRTWSCQLLLQIC